MLRQIGLRLWDEITLFVRWWGESLWFVVRHPFRTVALLLQGLGVVMGTIARGVVVFCLIDGLSNRR